MWDLILCKSDAWQLAMVIFFAHKEGSTIHTRGWGTVIDVCLTVVSSSPWWACTVVASNQILLDRKAHQDDVISHCNHNSEVQHNDSTLIYVALTWQRPPFKWESCGKTLMLISQFAPVHPNARNTGNCWPRPSWNEANLLHQVVGRYGKRIFDVSCSNNVVI